MDGARGRHKWESVGQILSDGVEQMLRDITYFSNSGELLETK